MSISDVTADDMRTEAQEIVQRLAGQPKWGDTVERGIDRASREAGLPYQTVRKLWYRDRRSIPSELMENLRRRLAAYEAKQARLYALEKATTNARLNRKGPDDAVLQRASALAGPGPELGSE